MYKAAFFDAGMTLIGPKADSDELVVDIVKRRGLLIDSQAVRRAEKSAQGFFWEAQRQDRHIWADEQKIQAFWGGYYDIVLRELGLRENVQEAAQEIYDDFNLHTNWVVFPDVVGTLTECRRRGLILGVVSDWGVQLVYQVLGPLGLTSYFDFMVVSAMVRAGKSSACIFEAALQRAGVAPGEAIHVGDNYVGDVLGARSAGITPVLIDRRQAIGKVDCLKISSLHELLEIVDGASSPI
ncbi:MAG: HAD-IA family hydrolase [Chloroflexi bacterium]|nr:HAD-IA family hydrolase [Chloroflexota bacterium]